MFLRILIYILNFTSVKVVYHKFSYNSIKKNTKSKYAQSKYAQKEELSFVANVKLFCRNSRYVELVNF